eukprot:m.197308 g.197308  ORF g.197308 m.197308 type:complete len:66 (-) comp20107_c0_seq1:332-529(-)
MMSRDSQCVVYSHHPKRNLQPPQDVVVRVAKVSCHSECDDDTRPCHSMQRLGRVVWTTCMQASAR